MKRNLILFLLSLLFPIQCCFGQNPVPKKNDPLKDSVEKYQEQKLFGKVLPFAEKWVEKLKQEHKEESPGFGTALDSWGEALSRTGKSKDAEPILIQALEMRKKVLGETHPDVATSLSSLGIWNSNSGNFKKAEQLHLQALEIRKKAHGENHQEVALSLNNLGICYWREGEYEKAELFYNQALEIQQKVLGPNHQNVALTLQNLGSLFHETGNLGKAEFYYLGALEIEKKAGREDHPEVASLLNNIGVLYFDMGNFAEAEARYLKALEIKKRALGEIHPEVAQSLNSLGILARRMGNYPKAEMYYLQALDIRRKSLGENHLDVAQSLNNLGNFYAMKGNFARAEEYHLKALEIRKIKLGENHSYVAYSLNNLAGVYMDMGAYNKAETTYLRSFELWKKVHGEKHPMVAQALHNLGGIYKIKGNYAKAESFYLQALELRKKVMGETHPELSYTIFDLATMHFAGAQPDKSEAFFKNWNAKKHAQIQRYFPFLSDKEKESFYETILSGDVDIFKSFCIDRYAGKKSIASDLYNDQLATKGLLLSSSSKWRHRIRSSRDTAMTALFRKWEASQDKLNKLQESTDSTERAGIDSLQAETEKMEKALSVKSENFARLADNKLVNWKEIQKALKPGEAAIEMVRVRKFGIEKTVTDTSAPQSPVYKIKGLTDTIYYAALIVKPESAYPEMVVLKNGNELEGKGLSFYKSAIRNHLEDSRSYKLFWDKIRARLGATRRVFFSPDGVYHNINLNTLQNPKTKKFLVEELDISLVTGTKDLLNQEPGDSQGMVAEMVGFPNYYNSGATVSIATEYRSSPKLSYKLRMNSDEVLAELPATKIETEKISQILQTKGWEVKEYTGDKALEETIKESNSPKVLHIATHGYFQPDTTPGSNPLLRSGLMLAGAGSTLKGERREGEEDGILTAYEAMNLNLDNTDLVVLSACETGLGEIKNGEGVYGLQRAFKVAGAKTLIMSLWKVNDESTQELMVRFYNHWLGKGAVGTAGQTAAVMTKRSAFLKAQKELKAKYPDPYYWGAFVMVGE